MVSTRNMVATLQECGICSVEKPRSRFPDSPPTAACLHDITTCTECLEQWVWTCMESNYQPSGAISCPDCEQQMIAQDDLQKVGWNRYQRRFYYIYKRITRSISPAWRWCLRLTCNEGQEHEPYDPRDWPSYDVCICYKCNAEACVLCDRPWHEGETCEQFAQRNLGHLVEDNLSQKVIETQEAWGTIKKCPQCCCPIQNDTSPRMLKVLCGRCRYAFDWNEAKRFDQNETNANPRAVTSGINFSPHLSRQNKRSPSGTTTTPSMFMQRPLLGPTLFRGARSLNFIASLRHMSNFRSVEHTVRAQHSRDRFAGAEQGHENSLRLHVKQYIPKSNPTPRDGDVTIIGAIADAFPKEMLEPMWDDFYEQMKSKGRSIRSIWVADPVNQGHSGVLNEKLLGPDPSWLDHGRDLLFLINQFQDDMPHPIVGIGHSMGAGHLCHLALLHPRLLHSLVLMDTVLSNKTAGLDWVRASINRRDLWPSRSAAAAKMRSNPAFQKWDPRVLDKYIEYGLRDLPTELHADLPSDNNPNDPPVTLQTTKAQEQYNYVRAAYEDDRMLLQEGDLRRDFWPEDVDANPGPFDRFENKLFYRRLPELRPSVLYVVGEQSEVSRPEARRERLERTGSGAGGSGGVKRGRVEEAVLDCGHLVPWERTTAAAEASASFVDRELKRWESEENNRRERWNRLSRKERVDINEAWRDHAGAKKSGAEKGKSAPPEKL